MVEVRVVILAGMVRYVAEGAALSPIVAAGAIPYNIGTVLAPAQPMLRVTKLTDYATLVLIALADGPEPLLSAAGLAERARLELPTVSKVLKPLAHAGLVEGVRGSSGGYRLARAPESIRLIEVVEAIEGPLNVTECAGEHSECSLETHCGVRGNWRHINHVVAEALGGISLAQMRVPFPATQASKGPGARAGAARRAIPLQLATD
jgi:FeS assembly SUF system regulator